MDGAVKSDLCAPARELERRSVARWGEKGSARLVGRHPTIRETLERTRRFAAAESPVLVSGETGAGKELLARALFLFSPRRDRRFVTVNCAQYGGGQPVVSELFGHRKGSFTGAHSDHRGIFEQADSGVVFLDEVGELPMRAQSMLLRTLAEGEIVPVGGVRRKRVDVRVLAATNRDLRRLVAEGRFREDLYYRLLALFVHVPPLRERGDDWKRIADHYLRRLNRRHGTRKRLRADAVDLLDAHPWPGNVREVRNLVEFGFYVSRSERIGLADIGDHLERASRRIEVRKALEAQARSLCQRMVEGEADFWELVHGPYIDRDLNRAEVRAVLGHALAELGHGSYKKALLALGVGEGEYLKAMDFLRHHRLKPQRRRHPRALATPAEPPDLVEGVG